MANTNFEQTLKNIDDYLWKESGCSTELDYIEQKSWIMFLKYLDDLEDERENEAILRGENYKRILEPKYRWKQWAAPKNNRGEYYHTEAMTGDDLIDFVNTDLFVYLKAFKEKSQNPETLEYKIGEVFSELRNKITSGYNLREILLLVDELKFQTSLDKHEMTHLYEANIQRMGNAGRNGGEYYTPRPLIRTIIKVVDPKIGETIYDPACGSAGFLCEAFKYLEEKVTNTSDMEILQKGTFFGKEKKGLAYIIATMNMIFHGVAAPNIIRTNTLAENLADVQQRDRKDIILANPPFGGNEHAQIQQNFNIKTSETAYLFMQHFIKMLKAGGRAGIVIKNTFLSNSDAASVSLRRALLEECDLHTVLDLPSGVFTGAGVKTVVLFFEKGRKTDKIWYYQLNLNRNLGKTNPLNEQDLEDFVNLQKTKAESENSWMVSVADLNESYDLSVKNPNKIEVVDTRTPREIAEQIRTLNDANTQLLNEILEMV